MTEHLTKILTIEFGEKAFQTLYKIPVEPRLKGEESLLHKAYYRGKHYTDPFLEIEDKVGVRLVLLLGQDVHRVGDAIQSEAFVWSATKARDHADEIAAKPYEFDYQSLHYVVQSKGKNYFEGNDIPAGLPCEIQIRTLLQHAYSEITHDTLYKPSVNTTPKMKRSAAKSMALIEATGDYFNELDRLIAEQIGPQEAMGIFLVSAYQRLVSEVPSGEDSPLNDLMIDFYCGFDEMSPLKIEKWFNDNQYIGGKIQSRRSTRMAFNLPAVLLSYYAASVAPNRSKKDNPLPDSELEAIFSDIGSSLW